MGLKKKLMITLHVNNDVALKALKSMEKKHHITIIDEIDLDSPALPGPALSIKAFKAWIAEAENSPTVSLQEAEKQWAELKKEIRKRIP